MCQAKVKHKSILLSSTLCKHQSAIKWKNLKKIQNENQTPGKTVQRMWESFKNQIFTIFISFKPVFKAYQWHFIFLPFLYFFFVDSCGRRVKVVCQKMLSLLWHEQQINKYGNKKLKNGLNLRSYTWVIFCFGRVRLKRGPKERETTYQATEAAAPTMVARERKINYCSLLYKVSHFKKENQNEWDHEQKEML